MRRILSPLSLLVLILSAAFAAGVVGSAPEVTPPELRHGLQPAGPALTPEQVIGQSMFFHVPEDERPALRERFDAVINKGEAFSYEIRAVYPTGEVGVFVSKLGPVFDGQAIIGACLVTRDITVQRQVEDAKRIADQRLREYVRLLKRSNEELERFASVASHDLQEPLRKIQAFGDRLRSRCRDELPEIGQDYLGRMNDAAQRMQHLINDLLTYSRLTSRKRLVTDIDLDRVLRIVASDLEVRVEESGGAIEIGPMPTIEADQTQMQQLFQNLLANALKFARKGIPPVVKVTAELSADGQRVRIDVADNGIGIQAKYHQRIFGIFERLHGRGEYQGTGVGLAVCRKIVEQHGGDIKIVSEEDQGSTFQITLPTKQPKEGDEAR